MAANAQSPSLDFLETRERFLPIKTGAILQKILDYPHFSEREREQFRLFLEMVRARFHFEFVEEIDRLKLLYDPFDPDRDTRPLKHWTAEEREQAFEELSRRYRRLLAGGNYTQLTREQLQVCMDSRNRWGLAVRVELDDYQALDFYYRGVREEERSLRSWSSLFRKTAYKVHVFSRVAILVRKGRDRKSKTAKSDVVLMKLFKDVALEDLKMMAPEARVQMKLLDKLKVGGTVAGGLLTPILKLFTAAIISPVVLLAILAGCIGAFFKGVFSFLTSKTKYMQTLSSSLYYQNLANNISALTRLVDSAEDEEAKEFLLAYCMLYNDRDRDYTLEELDARVEGWLREEFDLPSVDFEVDDAVRKLVDKDLLIERRDVAANGAQRTVLKVHDLPTSLKRLDQWWDDYFTADA
jgi:hypothetical protein